MTCMCHQSARPASARVPLAERADWVFHYREEASRRAEPVWSGLPASTRKPSDGSVAEIVPAVTGARPVE